MGENWEDSPPSFLKNKEKGRIGIVIIAADVILKLFWPLNIRFSSAALLQLWFVEDLAAAVAAKDRQLFAVTAAKPLNKVNFNE